MRNSKPAPLILRPRATTRDACIPLSGLLKDVQCSAKALGTAGSQIFSGGIQYAEVKLTAGLLSARDGLLSAKEYVEDILTLNIRTALKTAKATQGGLIGYSDLPTPWRINPHIKTGYRFCERQTDCVHSIFRVTNESVNIWSHAFGFFAIMAIAFCHFPNVEIQTTTSDNVFIVMFLIAAAKCMLFSCTYHTMNSIADSELNKIFTCVDYTGISLLMATSIMTTEHLGFYCHPTSWKLYITVTGILGATGLAIPWHPFFRGNEKAWLRVTFYASIMATGLFPPMFHLSYLYGIPWTLRFYAPLAKTLAMYMGGSAIYAAKVPERWIPGAFDFLGGSHNIWHFAVLGGVLLQYNAIIEMFKIGLEVATNECRPGLYG